MTPLTVKLLTPHRKKPRRKGYKPRRDDWTQSKRPRDFLRDRIAKRDLDRAIAEALEEQP